MKVTNQNLAIFASGSGSNAEAFFKFFRGNKNINICLLLSNNKNAFALQRAENFGIPGITFDRKEFYETDKILNLLKENQISFVVFSGFFVEGSHELNNQLPAQNGEYTPRIITQIWRKGDVWDACASRSDRGRGKGNWYDHPLRYRELR